MTEEKPKKKMGRPPKAQKGMAIFIPVELIDTVKLMIQANRQAKQQKQVQS
jgi:hypothetical protein